MKKSHLALENGPTLVELIEAGLVDLLSWTMLPHDLESIYRDIDGNKNLVGSDVLGAVNKAMVDQIEQAGIMLALEARERADV